MKIYITKPAHTKYGLIKLTPYSSVDDIVENSTFWFVKPDFEKPFICFLTDDFGWRGFSSDYQCSGKVKHFPEGAVKEAIKKKIRDSIDLDFYESLHNRHYKWIGELDVDLIPSETSGNFNLYLTKPDVWDIQFAGIDRATLWLYPPELKKEQTDLYDNDKFHYRFDGVVGIKGNYFRKFENKLNLMFWNDIVNSFDVSSENMDYFYRNINDKNHKEDQSSTEFVKEYYFNLILRGDK
jgi:hypothetical protein